MENMTMKRMVVAREFLGETHKDAEHALEGLAQPERPEATAHAELDRGEVRSETAERAREQVHEAVARREGTRGDEVELELVVQVSGDDVVHGKLDAEAEAVGGDHAPHAVVLAAEHLGLERVLLLQLAGGVQEHVVAVGEILAEEHHSDAGERVHEAGDDVRPAPGGVDAALSAGHHAGVDERHEELSDAAAEVTPARGGGVGDADALAVEHAGHPELARHEGGQTETDAEAADQEAGGVFDVGHAEAERSGEQEDDGQAVARSYHVADGSHDDTGDDGAGDGGEAGVAEVGLGELEVLADDRHHGCGREGGHEGHEEADPRHVEGSMVGEAEGEDVEALRLVLAVRIRREGGIGKGERHDTHGEREESDDDRRRRSAARGARRALPESALFVAPLRCRDRQPEETTTDIRRAPEGRARAARARFGGRERRRGGTYLSTGMVKVGCTMAAIVAFRTSAAGSGACQKVTSAWFREALFS
jgi:hypothetical protein